MYYMNFGSGFESYDLVHSNNERNIFSLIKILFYQNKNEKKIVFDD